MSYDTSVLQGVKPTKQELQGWYNPAILEQSEQGGGGGGPTQAGTSGSNTDFEKGYPPSRPGAAPHTPFFRSPKGYLTIGLGILVIIGVVVGASVGATRSHSHSDTKLNTTADGQPISTVYNASTIFKVESTVFGTSTSFQAEATTTDDSGATTTITSAVTTLTDVPISTVGSPVSTVQHPVSTVYANSTTTSDNH